MSPLPRILGIAFALLGTSVGVSAAERGQWMVPPAPFLVSNYVRSTRAPIRTHEIVLDVPQGANAKTKPTVSKSSGDPAVDAVAVRYVQLALQRSKTVQATAATKAQRFQIRLTAGALDPKVLPKHLQRPSEKVDPNLLVDMPRVPRLALSSSANAVEPEPLLVRLTIPAQGGMPDEAILVRSSGQVKVDAAVLLYALANARGKATGQKFTTEYPVRFVSQSGPVYPERPANFPTNDRLFGR